jgi:hypothetical protein
MFYHHTYSAQSLHIRAKSYFPLLLFIGPQEVEIFSAKCRNLHRKHPQQPPVGASIKARARSPFAALFEMLLCSSVQSVATARLLSTNFMPGDKQLLHSKKSRELETRVDHHNRKTHLSSWNLKGQAKVHKFFRLSQRLTKWCPKLSMQHSSYVRVGGCNTDEVCYLCSWPPWVGVSGFQYCRGQITVRIFGFKPQFV